MNFLSEQFRHSLMNLFVTLISYLPGEKLDDEEVQEVFKDCMDAEDDDGQIPYAREYFSK